MTSPFATLLRERQAELLPVMTTRAQAINLADGLFFTDEQIYQRSAATLGVFCQTLSEDPPTTYSDYWRQASYARFKSGISLEHMQRVLRSCNRTLREALRDALAGRPREQLEAVERCAAISEDSLIALHTAYQQAKEDLIQAQRASIRQLSTPIVPVYKGVLVVPLIGAIDAERANDLIERLLGGITRARAAVVIIDITGVPAIDTEVAHHLLQAARAAELLGAKVVFVGISPEAAQALIHIGVDLGRLRTLANLESGIEHALGALNLAIGPRGAGQASKSKLVAAR